LSATALIRMDREALFRRIVHLSAPLFLVYYFLPTPLWDGGPSREIGLLTVLAVALLFELFRLRRGVRVPGLRDYESRQISAAVWAGVALTLTMLFFPLSLAAPAVTGMALIDPLISVLRKPGWYPAVPLIAYFLLAFALLLLFYPSVRSCAGRRAPGRAAGDRR